MVDTHGVVGQQRRDQGAGWIWRVQRFPLTSAHSASSLRIGVGRLAVMLLSQRTTVGSRSSSSIPAAVSTSATTATECLIRVSSATSLRRIAAPGGVLDSEQDPDRSLHGGGLALGPSVLAGMFSDELVERRLKVRIGWWWELVPQPEAKIVGQVEQQQLLMTDRTQQRHVGGPGLLLVLTPDGAGWPVQSGDEQLLAVRVGLSQREGLDPYVKLLGGVVALLVAHPARPTDPQRYVSAAGRAIASRPVFLPVGPAGDAHPAVAGGHAPGVAVQAGGDGDRAAAQFARRFPRRCLRPRAWWWQCAHSPDVK